MSKYVVKTPLVVIKDDAGMDLYLYEGVSVPDGVDKDHLKMLVDEKQVGAPEEVPADDGSSEQPAKNASTEVWQDYARSQGATDEDLDGLGRDELVEKYGA